MGNNAEQLHTGTGWQISPFTMACLLYKRGYSSWTLCSVDRSPSVAPFTVVWRTQRLDILSIELHIFYLRKLFKYMQWFATPDDMEWDRGTFSFYYHQEKRTLGLYWRACVGRLYIECKKIFPFSVEVQLLEIHTVMKLTSFTCLCYEVLFVQTLFLWSPYSYAVAELLESENVCCRNWTLLNSSIDLKFIEHVRDAFGRFLVGTIILLVLWYY